MQHARSLGVVGVQSFKWRPFALNRYQEGLPPLFMHTSGAQQSVGLPGGAFALAGLSDEDRKNLVRATVRDIAQQVMGEASSEVSFDAPLSELGLDSLGADGPAILCEAVQRTVSSSVVRLAKIAEKGRDGREHDEGLKLLIETEALGVVDIPSALYLWQHNLHQMFRCLVVKSVRENTSCMYNRLHRRYCFIFCQRLQLFKNRSGVRDVAGMHEDSSRTGSRLHKFSNILCCRTVVRATPPKDNTARAFLNPFCNNATQGTTSAGNYYCFLTFRRFSRQLLRIARSLRTRLSRSSCRSSAVVFQCARNLHDDLAYMTGTLQESECRYSALLGICHIKYLQWNRCDRSSLDKFSDVLEPLAEPFGIFLDRCVDCHSLVKDVRIRAGSLVLSHYGALAKLNKLSLGL
eukprot:284817072_3